MAKDVETSLYNMLIWFIYLCLVANQFSVQNLVDPFSKHILPKETRNSRESIPGPPWMAVRQANHFIPKGIK